MGMIISIALGLAGLVWTGFYYKTYIRGELFSRYPEPVAAKLRRALYYTNIRPAPRQALRYYREALDAAAAAGMDPAAPETLGIKIQLAAFFEGVQQPARAIGVLEHVRSECVAEIARLQQQQQEQQQQQQQQQEQMQNQQSTPTQNRLQTSREAQQEVQQAVSLAAGTLVAAMGAGPAGTEQAVAAHNAATHDDDSAALLDDESNGDGSKGDAVRKDDAVPMQTVDFGQRRRQLLTTALRVCAKLGALYADPAVGNTVTARERLEWAVQTLLEQHHAEAPRHRHHHNSNNSSINGSINDSITRPLPSGNGHTPDADAGAGAGADADEWLLPRAEAGALFESFGTLLESLSLHHLAAPLFVQALLLLGNSGSSSSRGHSSSGSSSSNIDNDNNNNASAANTSSSSSFPTSIISTVTGAITGSNADSNADDGYPYPKQQQQQQQPRWSPPPTTDCHAVVLMNNIAVCLAQLRPGAELPPLVAGMTAAAIAGSSPFPPSSSSSASSPSSSSSSSSSLSPSRAYNLRASAAWANRALTAADAIMARSDGSSSSSSNSCSFGGSGGSGCDAGITVDECTLGAVAALLTLADLAAMVAGESGSGSSSGSSSGSGGGEGSSGGGTREEAVARCRQARQMAVAAGYADGVRQADERLARLR